MSIKVYYTLNNYHIWNYMAGSKEKEAKIVSVHLFFGFFFNFFYFEGIYKYTTKK